jgi:hypothetical protein
MAPVAGAATSRRRATSSITQPNASPMTMDASIVTDSPGSRPPSASAIAPSAT